MIKAGLQELCAYLKDNRWKILIFNALLLMIWGPWLYNASPRIDTEAYINSPYGFFNWQGIGRQGGIFTKYVFGLRWFNPYFATAGGYLLICIAGILMGYLFWRISHKDLAIYSAFGLICFTAPIMTEQFYFDLQIFEVGWAYVLCTVAAGATVAGVLQRSKALFLVTVLCLIWCFSTYQIFVVLYVVLIVTCFLLLYQRWTVEKTQTKPLYGNIIIGSIVAFVTAFALNSLITKLFFSSGSDYLTDQIAWLSQPASSCVKSILNHIAAGFLGNSTFYTRFYGIFAVLTMLVIAVSAIKVGKNWWALVAILAAGGLQICPFLLTIAFGCAPNPRVQLAYPMVIACDITILFTYCTNKRWGKFLLCVLTIAATALQANRTMRMIYTDEIRAQEDVRILTEIEQRVDSLSASNKPIAFVGTYQNQLNASCLRGELIGMSILNCNSNALPHYCSSSNRVTGLSNVVGFDFVCATESQIFEARKQALTMPSWPATGSVVDAGEYVIVKLSEDDWAEELITPEIKAADFKKPIKPAGVDSMQVTVDSLVIEENMLTIQGWAFLNAIDSTSVQIQMYLYDEAKGTFYQLPTVRKQRPDLVYALENGELYKSAGYYVKADISALKKRLADYQLWVGIETAEDVNMINTGYALY